MDSRTRLAIGGMSAVAASVAVICAVALTNSAALSEAQGSSIESAPVVVPSAGVSTGAATADVPEPVAAPVPETDRSQDQPIAEVVPAPAPKVVPAPEPEAGEPTTGTATTEPPAGTGGTDGTPSDDEAVAEAERSGSWDAAREWAARLGWSQARIDAWIDRLEKARGSLSEWRDDHRSDSDREGPIRDSGEGDRSGGDSASENSSRDGDADRRAGADATAQKVQPAPKTQERSSAIGSTQDRPAHAGAKAEHRSTKPGLGAKKDRSRDTPDRRD